MPAPFSTPGPLTPQPAFNPPESEADAARAHAEMVLAKRQAPTGMIQIPGCVTGCMAAANVGQCTSNFDYLCLCSSKTYQQAVMVSSRTLSAVRQAARGM